MCGGINISQCIPSRSGAEAISASVPAKPRSALAASVPSLKYNLARVVSYTLIGAVVGGIGSVFSLTGGAKGVIQIIAGVFMVLMGLGMFGVLPGLGRLIPRLPRAFGRFIESAKSGGKGPVVVGLLNGLMPCGPLQSMQIFALSTGSPVQGALSMFFFSLGTTPLMFGLGALSSLIGSKFTRRAMTVGAALVVFLGLFMFSNGLTLSGAPIGIMKNDAASSVASGISQNAGDSWEDANGNSYADEDGVQIVRSVLQPGGYPHITVRVGAPVRWIIDAPDGSINGCNGVIYIPEYEIEHAFEPGENRIEFTPEEAGEFPYSCWMGMITSSITVQGSNRNYSNAASGFVQSGFYGLIAAPERTQTYVRSRNWPVGSGMGKNWRGV
jgi:sulfite exporter TauE/SafE